MPEIGPQHPLTYRQSIAEPIFDRVVAGGSCAVVGAASMGKSRLLQFLLRKDVQQHYLGQDAKNTLLAWADCNRMAEISEWGLYELMLTALVEAVDEDAREPLLKLRREAIIEHNALLAQRNVEIALRMLCHEEGLRIVLILDEFDDSYQQLSSQTLSNLRSLRDMNKYVLTFVLFTRDTLDHLRAADDAQGFYELFSRNYVGLTPYQAEDATRVIAQQAARRSHQLADTPADYAAQVLGLSGGHPGLSVALLDGLTKSQPQDGEWKEWAIHLPGVQEECRKLWGGLRVAERQALNHIAHGAPSRYADRWSLELKGLVIAEGERNVRIFAPLFANYAAAQSAVPEASIMVDSTTGQVYMNGQHVAEAPTGKEFDLLEFLYKHSNSVCSIEKIIAGIYPGPDGVDVNDNTVASLVGRVRKKIERDPKHPRFLHTRRGRGYELTPEPEIDTVEVSS